MASVSPSWNPLDLAMKQVLFSPPDLFENVFEYRPKNSVSKRKEKNPILHSIHGMRHWMAEENRGLEGKAYPLHHKAIHVE